MARKNRHIRFEPTTASVRSRIDYGEYYAAESTVTPSVMYVLDEDVVAIVAQNITVMLSPDIIEEINMMLDYINDPDNIRILRMMRGRRESEKYVKKRVKRFKSDH